MYILSKKNHLAQNLMMMKKKFHNDYNFFPETWLLPVDQKEFRARLRKKGNKFFIVKPEALCQGRGIFLTNNPDDV